MILMSIDLGFVLLLVFGFCCFYVVFLICLAVLKLEIMHFFCCGVIFDCLLFYFWLFFSWFGCLFIIDLGFLICF